MILNNYDRNMKLEMEIGDNAVLIYNDSGEYFVTTGWILTDMDWSEEHIMCHFYCRETDESDERLFSELNKTFFKTEEDAEIYVKEYMHG